MKIILGDISRVIKIPKIIEVQLLRKAEKFVGCAQSKNVDLYEQIVFHKALGFIMLQN